MPRRRRERVGDLAARVSVVPSTARAGAAQDVRGARRAARTSAGAGRSPRGRRTRRGRSRRSSGRAAGRAGIVGGDARRSRRRGRTSSTTSTSSGIGSPRPERGPASSAGRAAPCRDGPRRRRRRRWSGALGSSSRIEIPARRPGIVAEMRETADSAVPGGTVASWPALRSGARSSRPSSSRRRAARAARSSRPRRTTVVFGSGNADADLMFVGEAPGRQRGQAGRPVRRPGRAAARHAAGRDRPDARRRLRRQRPQVPAAAATAIRCRRRSTTARTTCSASSS